MSDEEDFDVDGDDEGIFDDDMDMELESESDARKEATHASEYRVLTQNEIVDSMVQSIEEVNEVFQVGIFQNAINTYKQVLSKAILMPSYFPHPLSCLVSCRYPLLLAARTSE